MDRALRHLGGDRAQPVIETKLASCLPVDERGDNEPEYEQRAHDSRFGSNGRRLKPEIGPLAARFGYGYCQA